MLRFALDFGLGRASFFINILTNVGIETDGKHEQFERPVLILKKFYKDMLWVLPLTTHKHDDSFHKEVAHDRGKSWVMLTQIRTVDSKRLLRKLGTISHEEFITIQNSIRAFITSNPA